MARSLLISLIALLGANAYCQDPIFSQFYSNPLYLNPAYAGNSEASRVHLNYRNQWPGVSNSFNTYSVSYDKFIEAISGGMGIIATHDIQGEGNIASTRVGLIYAYTGHLTKKLSIKAGFELSYFQNSIDWQNLTFADMIDKNTGAISTTQELEGDNLGMGGDLSSGFLLYWDKVFIGCSQHHLTEPEQTIYGFENNEIKRKFTFHTGANVDVKSAHGKLTISPNLLVQKQSDFIQLNAGCYLQKDPIVLGSWYRVNDAVVFLLGFENENLTIGYSFDYTISKLSTYNSLGSHELSFSYTLKHAPKSKEYNIAACPKF